MFRTKLSPFVRKQLVACISKGMPITKAANAIGVSTRSFSRWMERGENPSSIEDAIYVTLLDELEKAEAIFIKHNVELLELDAVTNPETAKWFLERRCPAEFGKRVEVELGASKVLDAIRDMAQRTINAPDTVSVLPESSSKVPEIVEISLLPVVVPNDT